MKRRKAPPPPLPPPCSECRPYGGLWRKDAYTGGMERCECERGKLLREGLGRKRRKPKPPKEPPPGFDGRMASTGE